MRSSATYTPVYPLERSFALLNLADVSESDTMALTQRMNSSVLPLELTDRIIDFLHDDVFVLRNCSLTHRSLLPRCRYHRFRFVSLDWKTYELFEQILTGAPELGSYVRELRISVSMFERPPTWVDESFPSIAPKLNNVTTLYLTGNGEYKAAPLQKMKSVREVFLTHCEVYSMNEFITLLGSLPNLDTICCRDVLIGRSQKITASPPARGMTLKKLEFSSSRLDPPMLVDWLLSESLHIHVESITIVPLQKQALTPVGKFLEAAGPSVKHLRIALIALLVQGGFDDVLNRNFTLAHSTNLRSLEFGSPAAFAAQYAADDLSFSWVASMLQQVSSPYIESITFSLWDGDLNELSSPVWDKIPVLLASQKFSSLKKLVFRVWGKPSAFTIITDTIKGKLPEFCNKGILHFDSTPDQEY